MVLVTPVNTTSSHQERRLQEHFFACILYVAGVIYTWADAIAQIKPLVVTFYRNSRCPLGMFFSSMLPFVWHESHGIIQRGVFYEQFLRRQFNPS